MLKCRVWEVNLTIVREFFELHKFLVSSLRKEKGRRKSVFDLWVINTSPLRTTPNFFLDGYSVQGIRYGLVKVLGWHGEVFTPSLIKRLEDLENLGELGKAEREVVKRKKDFSRILVLSRLPTSSKLREEVKRILENKGIDHVLTFDYILWAIIEKLEKNENYSSSLLEILRVLKAYNMIKNPQLEFPTNS